MTPQGKLKVTIKSESDYDGFLQSIHEKSDASRITGGRYSMFIGPLEVEFALPSSSRRYRYRVSPSVSPSALKNKKPK